MGLVFSPHEVIWNLMWESEAVRGDRRDPKHPFIWESASLNLPGELYSSFTIAWMEKVKGETQELVSDFAT